MFDSRCLISGLTRNASPLRDAGGNRWCRMLQSETAGAGCSDIHLVLPQSETYPFSASGMTIHFSDKRCQLPALTKRPPSCQGTECGCLVVQLLPAGLVCSQHDRGHGISAGGLAQQAARWRIWGGLAFVLPALAVSEPSAQPKPESARRCRRVLTRIGVMAS